ncbi:PaaI family thioesterase [candidate division TA06 bacterium]|nr:PaaI family thioesterase [candidate division TA06 bacterium]
MKLNDDHFCFACGHKNSDGLQLKFTYPQPGTCRAEFVPEQKYQGWSGILHGGIISTLLDEALAHAVGEAEGGGGASEAVTAELTVRFKKPVRIDNKIVLTGKVDKDNGKIVEASSEITDETGLVLASARGKLVRPAVKAG